MHHPFSEDTSNLSINQLYEKINELTKKYFLTNNTEVKQQIQTFIDYYKQEIKVKEAAERKKAEENGEIDLDKLINIE
jgi:flagellar biosynthesis protein FliP